MKLTTLLLFFTTLCFAQEKVDTLKLIPAIAEKLNAIEKREKELMSSDVVKEIQMLGLQKSTIVESEFTHAGKPVPNKSQYVDGNILYIEDKKK